MARLLSRSMIAVALVLVLVFAFAGLAMAQDGGQGTVVGEGFNGPMGVKLDPDGNIWVIDSGTGGEDVTQAINPETNEMITVTVGDSSRIARINIADGSVDDVAKVGSYGTPASGFSGGNHLALLDGKLYASVGDWDDAPTATAPSGIAVINEIGEDGAVTQVFDAWAFEVANNPYGVVYHAHPFGLTAGEDGKLWVADAGANSIYSVDPATGEASDITPLEPLPGAFPRPDYDNKLLTDPVPTAIAFKDGVKYVSLLSGVPFVPGSAKVITVGDDGKLADYATGLTMLMDLRVGPDGELYAVSFGGFGEQGPVPNSGSLLRIKEGDASEVIAGGLSFPSSVDFDADGNAYVTVNAVGAPGSGQVLRFDGATEAKGTPYADVLAAMAAAAAPAAGESAAVTGTTEVTGTEAATETQAATETEAVTSTLEPANTMVNLNDALLENGSFTTLISMIKSAGLTDALSGEGPYTLFAPTDAAFQALSMSDRVKLYRKADALEAVLKDHVVPQLLSSADITDGLSVETLGSEPIVFGHDGITLTVNGVPVSTADIAASNGAVFAIDGVLMPGGETDNSTDIISDTLEAAESASAATETAEAAATEVVTETAEPEAATEVTGTVPAAAAEAMTETVEAAPVEAMTETVEAAPVEAMTETVEAAPVEAMTETVEAAPVEAMTETVEAAPAEAMTETAEAAPAEAVTETAEAAPAEAATETAEAAPAEAMTETAEAAPAEAAATEEAPTPEALPTTGGSQVPSFGLLVGALAVVAIAGMAWATRRRSA